MSTVALASPVSAAPFVVARAEDQFQLVATAGIEAGAWLFHINGIETDRATRYSVQVGAHRHVDVDPAVPVTERIVRYPWRFMNHSCDPNAIVAGREVVAARRIQPGDEITFDYNTTEYDIAAPFACLCGSPLCVGRIRGYRHLDPAERERLRPRAAAYLGELIEAAVDPSRTIARGR